MPHDASMPVFGSFDPARRDFSSYGLTCMYWRPTVMIRPDHHSEVELNLVLAGSVTYLLGGRRQVAAEGRLSVFWGATPHQVVDFSTDAKYIVATIPLQFVLGWALSDTFVQALFAGAFLSETSGAANNLDALLFDKWARDLQTDSVACERMVLLEMQARLTRFATAFSARPAAYEPLPESALNKVERMACHIARYYTEKLTVQDIADHVALAPYSAMSLFKRSMGVTIVNYIVQHRVAHAQRMLATTDESITRIAYQSGFLSVSRFNDAFHRSCACAPRVYRASMRKSTAGP